MRSTRSQRKNINGKHKTMIYLSHAAMIEMVHRLKRFLLVSGGTNDANERHVDA